MFVVRVSAWTTVSEMTYNNVSSGTLNLTHSLTHSVCLSVFSKVLQRLIDGGCRVDATEKTFGLTPLDMAILLGDVEATALLVSTGGDPDHLMKTFASSQLYDAVVAVDRQLVKSLLRYDVDLDVNLPFGAFDKSTTLDAHHQHVDADAGEVWRCRYEGLTPLTVAAQLTTVDVLDVIRLLQKHGLLLNALFTDQSINRGCLSSRATLRLMMVNQ